MHEFDHRRKPTVGLASREARLTLVSNDSVWLNKNIYTTYNSTIYIYANEIILIYTKEKYTSINYYIVQHNADNR